MHGPILEDARFESASLARAEHNTNKLVEREPQIRKVAFLGDYLPRKCGIATFTSDLLTWVAAAHPQNQCFAVPVNDIEGGYEYPDVVRFEIEEQDLTSSSVRRTSSTSATWTSSAFSTSLGFTAGPPAAICWRWFAN